MKRILTPSTVMAGVAVLLIATAALAGPSTRKTKITFSGPVRVPGTILPAGTYFFQAPLVNNRTVVTISSEDGSHITKVMGIPDFTRKRDHDVITFGENECGPKAIKAWFYPGSGTGVRFVYPKDEAEVIAAACNEPVPEIHENRPDMAQITVYRIYLITPQKQEAEYDSQALSQSDQADQNGFDAGATEESQPERDTSPIPRQN